MDYPVDSGGLALESWLAWRLDYGYCGGPGVGAAFDYGGMVVSCQQAWPDGSYLRYHTRLNAQHDCAGNCGCCGWHLDHGTLSFDHGELSFGNCGHGGLLLPLSHQDPHHQGG